MPTTTKSVIPANAGIQFVGLTALKINQMRNLGSGPGYNHSESMKLQVNNQ